MVRFPTAFLVALLPCVLSAADYQEGDTPADHLPPHMRQLTSFGERADWSHDGRRILFLSKTFGDAMELEVATGRIRNLTAHYPHHGYTRALYLANGDVLLAGPLEYDLTDTRSARRNCYLFVLDQKGGKPAAPLGVRCNEGPAVSRQRMHIAWPEWTDPKPGAGNTANSVMFEADVAYRDGKPVLENKRLIIDGSDLPFRATMETQNFRPPAETELIFSAYANGGRYCDVLGIDLKTKKITRYTDEREAYDEPEGIYPDGKYTLVESDAHSDLGSRHIDLYRLKLDGSGESTRLTYFNEFPNFKCSNPVVSDDGKFIACQMAKSGDEAGVGHGLFLFDIEASGL